MTPEKFPEHIRDHILPTPSGEMRYHCLGCAETFGIEKLLYTCPACGAVLLLQDMEKNRLKGLSGETWREILDYRRMLKIPALKGIYRFHEFIGPVIPLDAILYLGEGHTPMVEANATLQQEAGLRFFYKNDGQNPSASFKDRGMASALSYIHFLVKNGTVDNVLAVCASTGDTSAAAALYASYLAPLVKSAVLLPHGKVTPQQLSQPLGSGASVYEIPGVFDDCMKVVEALSEKYNVALLNSKNAWRILGQESYSYEIAQDLEFDMKDKVVVVPIGNAGNITAVMAGFLKFHSAGILTDLPKIIGVQSDHANPVYQYYLEPDAAKRHFIPMTVKPSVAQAAMIGNPVSMPRVISLVQQYNERSGHQNVFFISVPEQEIMDAQLRANRNGHIACTHGGETLAGLIRAKKAGWITENETAIIDSTAHALKFSGFQEMYFEDRMPEEYQVQPKAALRNAPRFIRPESLKEVPAPGKPLTGEAFQNFVEETADAVAEDLGLSLRD